jgi:hypothetical protein
MPGNAISTAARQSSEGGAIHMGFVIAWLLCAVFYFMQYALRSAPGVMMPELTAAFALDVVSVSSLIGLYYYSYSIFSILVGAALDRLGGKTVIPVGIVLVAVGAALFGLGSVPTAQFGRLLQARARRARSLAPCTWRRADFPQDTSPRRSALRSALACSVDSLGSLPSAASFTA